MLISFFFVEQLTSAHYDYDKLPKIKKNNDKEMVNNKKKDAFKHAMKQVMAKMKEMCGDEEEDDDDDDDDDSSDASDFSMYSDGYDDGGPYSSSKRRKKELKYSEKDVSLFFKSLMNNVVFDMGFQVWGIHSDDDKNCWCPCGKHMVAWRECFVIEHLAGKGSDAYCEAPSKMTPLGKFIISLYRHVQSNNHLQIMLNYFYSHRRSYGASTKEG